MNDRAALIESILNYRGLAERYVRNGIDLYEGIMDKHGASDDDSDPIEGFFVTMSDKDLSDALGELVHMVWGRGILPICINTRNFLLNTIDDIDDVFDSTSEYYPEYRFQQLKTLRRSLVNASNVALDMLK